MSLLADGASTISRLVATGATTVGGIAAAGAGGGINLAGAYLSSSCIIAFMSSIKAPLMSSKVQFPSYWCSISYVFSIGIAFRQSGLIGFFSNLRRISLAIDFGLESVLTSLPPFRP